MLVMLMLGGLPAQAQSVGACAYGEAEADLDVNHVRARLYNNGNLFWRGQGNVYTVPKWSHANAVFNTVFWAGGLVEGQLRFSGTNYGSFESWPGPLDDLGNPPADCAAFDRIFKISREDLQQYEQTGQATADLRDWPWRLGAPVEDGDGNPDNYDLAAGDRPKRYGDQMAWWVMNDAGNAKTTPPIGLEVQVTAYALHTGDALNNTTFYRYRLLNKGAATLSNAYAGFFVDPDLGDAGNDYVGSDTLREMGFVYNGTDFERSFDGYGDLGPALGYVILQGPLVDRDGKDNDHDGVGDEAGERLGMTSLSCIWKSRGGAAGEPGNSSEFYNCLQGQWRDGSPMTVGADGLGGDKTTRFMFPADPPAYWSEENVGATSFTNYPGDRRFVIGMGSFVMQPGDEQEIVFAIVWSEGLSRLHAVERLKADADLVRAFFAGSYPPAPLPPAPSAAPVPIAPAPGAVLEREEDPFALDRWRPADFSWEPAAQNLYYRVQVAADPSFAAPAGDYLTIGRNQTDVAIGRVISSLQPDLLYYWRVRAENEGGAGPWSEPRPFAVSTTPLPASFAIRGNYPNPFSGTTTLVFDLFALAEVRVEVFDVLGRRVRVVADQRMSPGTGRTLQLDDAGLSSGVYFYRITARVTVDDRPQPAWQATGRMAVVK